MVSNADKFDKLKFIEKLERAIVSNFSRKTNRIKKKKKKKVDIGDMGLISEPNGKFNRHITDIVTKSNAMIR